MDKLVHVVLSSLRQTSLSQRTTAANLANVETVGFRADDTANFQAAYLAAAGEPTSRVYSIAAPQSISTRGGPLESTGNPLDDTAVGVKLWVLNPRLAMEAIVRVCSALATVTERCSVMGL